MQKTYEISIPLQYFNKFIGKNGQTIKYLSDNFNCKIFYDCNARYIDQTTNNSFQPVKVLITDINYKLLLQYIDKYLFFKNIQLIKELLFPNSTKKFFKNNDIFNLSEINNNINGKIFIMFENFYIKITILAYTKIELQNITNMINNIFKSYQFNTLKIYNIQKTIKNNLLKNQGKNIKKIASQFDAVLNIINSQDNNWAIIFIETKTEDIQNLIIQYMLTDQDIVTPRIEEIMVRIGWKYWYNNGKKGEFMIVGSFQQIQNIIKEQSFFTGPDKEVHLIMNIPLTEIANLYFNETKYHKITGIDKDGIDEQLLFGGQIKWLNCDNIFKKWAEYIIMILQIKISNNIDPFNGLSILGLFFKNPKSLLYDGVPFVGGSFDSTKDVTLFDTAKREMKEEIGLEFCNHECENFVCELPTTSENKKIWLVRACDLMTIV